MVIWSANFIVVKATTATFPPVSFAFIRFGLSAVALLIVTRAVEGSLRMPRRDLLAVLVLGSLGFGIYQALWASALVHTTAGTSSLLIATTPVFTMLLASSIGADTLSRPKLVGAAIAFAGVALVIAAGGGLTLDTRLIGELMTLGASVLWAVYMAFGAPFLRRHSPLLTTSWAMVGGTIALAPIGLFQLVDGGMPAVTPAVVGAFAYSGLVAAAVSNVAIFRGVALLGPTRVANFQFLVPALAVAVGAIVLHERVEIAQVLGGLGIVLGILIARRDRSVATGPRGRQEPSAIEAEQIEPA